MKYYLIAGEASGDLHASNLMQYIKKFDSQATFRFFGGDLMLKQGGTLVKHYSEMAFMGIFEVLKNLKAIRRNFALCRKDLIEHKPDVLILIDYPGFNLEIAKFASKESIKVVYYISPKIWAWKKSRGWKIKKYIDEMYVIFPFEEKFYEQFDYKVNYVGNPLLDSLEQKKKDFPTREQFLEKHQLSGKPIVALLAGSRKQEIEKMLPFMTRIAEKYPNFEHVVAAAPGIAPEFYQKLIAKKNIHLLFGETYELLNFSHTALVNSGTATLEAALLNIPQVVCYKMLGGKLLYWIGKHLFNIKFVSLVNIILNKEVVKELIQHLLTTKNLETEVDKLLYDEKYRNAMKISYAQIRKLLGKPGASERAAKKIVERLGVVHEN